MIDFNAIKEEVQKEADERLTESVKREYAVMTGEVKRLKKSADSSAEDYAEVLVLAEAKLEKLLAVTDKDSFVEWQNKVKHADDIAAWDTDAAE